MKILFLFILESWNSKIPTIYKPRILRQDSTIPTIIIYTEAGKKNYLLFITKLIIKQMHFSEMRLQNPLSGGFKFTQSTRELNFFMDWCIFKSPFAVNCFSQWLQLYFTIWWTDWICLARFPLIVKCFPHWLHSCVTFSWTDVMWIFRNPFVVNFLPYFLMDFFDMTFQTALRCSFKFTLITRILDFRMDWFNVSPQMRLSRSLISTLITWVLDFSMNWLNICV